MNFVLTIRNKRIGPGTRLRAVSGQRRFESKQTPPGGLNSPWFVPSNQSKFDMSKRFSWAVTPLHRRKVPRALLLARPAYNKGITMPVRTLKMLTDADCGLPDDPVAQEQAEEYIRAAISYRLKQDAKAQTRAAKVMAVEVPLEDDSFIITDVPAYLLDGIASELRRISNRSGGPREYLPSQA